MLIFPALIKLDDYELTDQGRQPVSVEREGRMIENQLASGKIKKYFKKVATVFNISWEMLPSNDDSTIDGNLGRDSLNEMFKDSKETHILTYSDQDGNEKVFTVWVDSYNEEVTRRSSEDFLWNVSLSLREQ